MSEEEKKPSVDQQDVESKKQLGNLSEKLAEKKKIKKKKNMKRAMQLAGVLFFIYVLWFLFKPTKATEEYAICKTLLELYVPYPPTIYVSEIASTKDGAMKIWYTHTNAFGEFRMEPFECKLGRDENGQAYLSRLRFNNIDVQEDEIASLNHAMHYFNANPKVMNLPTPLPDTIGGLHLDIEGARRIQLDITK